MLSLLEEEKQNIILECIKNDEEKEKVSFRKVFLGKSNR